MIRVILAALLISSCATIKVVTAATPCLSRATIINGLATNYAEAPIARGLTVDGDMIEVFAARTGDTWTIVLTRAIGCSYLVSSGEFWQLIPFKLKGDKS